MKNKLYCLDSWLEEIIAHPITKSNLNLDQIKIRDGVMDATVFLRNTKGWGEWELGQKEFEKWLPNGENHARDPEKAINEKKEIQELYKNFDLSGIIVDVGGSVGTFSIIDGKTHFGVCIEINANHIGSVMDGFVFGTAKLVYQGRTTHIWSIEIKDEKQKLISTSRMTMMIIERKK